MMIEYMRAVFLKDCGLRSARPQNPPRRGWDVRVSWGEEGKEWGGALKDNKRFLFPRAATVWRNEERWRLNGGGV